MTSASEMWDRRFAEEGWPSEPDPYLVELAETLPKGRGIDLGAGPGRNSLWLAAKGWDMTLVDASRVGLDQALEAAGKLGVTVHAVCTDVFAWEPEESAFDLAIVANLHPGPEGLAAVLSSAAMALRPGGHLYVVGHHVSSFGRHGPPDPDRLLTEQRLEKAMPKELAVELLETRQRPADHGHPHHDHEAGQHERHHGGDGATHAVGEPDTVVVAWATRSR